MFNETDLTQINERGSELDTIQSQITYFKKGFPYLSVQKAATIGDGILRLSSEELGQQIQAYEAQLPQLEVVKFVPASGAASRMFKALFAYLNGYEEGNPAYNEDVADHHPDVVAFFGRLQQFAFYPELIQALEARGISPESATKVEVLETLLTDKGLNYGSLPKGLLTFHRYGDATRTPVAEHLVEGANYGKDAEGMVRLHFTVSPEHREAFVAHIAGLRASYEALLNARFDISFSEQKPSTDTIAVDMDNNPFRQADGSMLFRPGGHGALLENLNDIQADLIFIKNIDNVVPDHLKEDTYRYKKALAGVLLDYQQQIFGYLRQMDEGKADLREIATFLEESLCVQPPKDYEQMEAQQQLDYLRTKLNRPIRVCGMVKNEGEPGGGPFWAQNTDGTVSLQVVESAQIDPNDEAQQAIQQNATHFNPVDLVCAVKDYRGSKFNLIPFRDPETGFISFKSKDGKDLKAQELPGLWNGSMSNWNTLFVEVPVITFNPVKKVNDLLRDQHQGVGAQQA